MNEVTLTNSNLPTNIEDLSRFALIGREKLVAVRAEIRAIKKVGMAKEVQAQKKAEAQQLADVVTDAEVKLGELLAELPQAQNGGATKKENRSTTSTLDFSETKMSVKEKYGLTDKQVKQYQLMAKHPEVVAKAKEQAKKDDDIVSRSLVLNMIKQEQKEEQIAKAKQNIASQQASDFIARLKIGNGIGYAPAEKYDLLLTDPPYSTDVEDIDSFVESWLFNALNGVKDTGFAYVFIGAYPNEIKAYLNAKIPSHIELVQPLIWTYKNTLGNNPKDRYKLNYQMCLFYRGVDAPSLDCPLTNEQWAVQEINAPDGRLGNRYHAWQKPDEIAERFVRHSTKQGMTIFDPFACTGTFLLAGARLGRKAYGFEIDKDNAKIAFERGVHNGW